jgi:hypothetical protein
MRTDWNMSVHEKFSLHRRCKMLQLLQFQSKQELPVHLGSHTAPCSTHTTSKARQTRTVHQPKSLKYASLRLHLAMIHSHRTWHTADMHWFLPCSVSNAQRRGAFSSKKQRTNEVPATIIWPCIAQHFTGLLQTRHTWFYRQITTVLFNGYHFFFYKSRDISNVEVTNYML